MKKKQAEINTIFSLMAKAEGYRYVINDIVKNIDETKLNIDSFYCIKAIGSMINNIVSNKIDNIIEMGKKQVNLTEFIETFDNNYIENMQGVLCTINSNEISYFIESLNLIQKYVDFFEDFVKRMKNCK